MTGKLISIEGGEGAGKSTAMTAVLDALSHHGLRSLQTREPGGTSLGEAVRQLLLDPARQLAAHTELLLMFASRAQLVRELIEPALADGVYVVSDRFTDASFAYQGGGRGLDSRLIAELERNFVGIKPDLTLLLDVDVEQGLARARARGGELDRIETEHTDFFDRVRDIYLQRAQREPKRFRLIDASQSATEVAQQVKITVQNWLSA